MTPLARLRSVFWDLRPVWRRPARRLRRVLSLLAYRLRHLAGADLPPRVVTSLVPDDEVFPHPAIAVRLPDGDPSQGLAQQTETSWSWASDDGRAPYLLLAEGDTGTWPPTLIESLLLTAAALPLSFFTSGRAAAAGSHSGPSTVLGSANDNPQNPPVLALQLTDSSPPSSDILGRAIPHITNEVAQASPADHGVFRSQGPWYLRGNLPNGGLHHQTVRNPATVLGRLPAMAGPRTALFVLPFLAVGGAERLLFDLLLGWQGRYRLLVVTLEPHRAELGQTVDRCRQLTPHVYTLGDWLPREAHAGAISHLLRRYQVEVLVSWNGTVEFYDRVASWRRQFPKLRICHQLYNHRGGWIERVTRRLSATLDVHLAVNQHIAQALVEHGAAEQNVTVVHHGVAVPPLPDGAQRQAERRRCRYLLGLPQDAVVVGTFIRLHAQKRPLDVVEVARRLAPHGVHFLLAGGGPLDTALDQELARAPLPNFTRLPLQSDVETLYSAVDLCLSTSSYEGLPIFLMDGLARALPCVATAVGEIPELLAHGGGVLVEHPGDLDALAQGVLSLVAEDHRQTEGQRGRKTVEEHFSLAQYRKRYEALLFPSQEETHG